VAPSFGLQGTTTVSRVFDRAVGPARQIMSVLGLHAGLAIVLGTIGIHGVISHFATRRRRHCGRNRIRCDWHRGAVAFLPAWRAGSTDSDRGTRPLLS
jgi:hypothetical protein